MASCDNEITMGTSPYYFNANIELKLHDATYAYFWTHNNKRISFNMNNTNGRFKIDFTAQEVLFKGGNGDVIGFSINLLPYYTGNNVSVPLNSDANFAYYVTSSLDTLISSSGMLLLGFSNERENFVTGSFSFSAIPKAKQKSTIISLSATSGNFRTFVSSF